MDGLDRVTLGVRRKFGQKLQGEKFDKFDSHTPSVALSKLSIRQTWLFYLVGYLFSAHLHKKFQLSVSILRASKALQEPEGGVYSDRGCRRYYVLTFEPSFQNKSGPEYV